MPLKNLHYHNDFPYFFKSDACKSCGGKCCRGGQGYVWLSLQELEKMAAAREISAEVFTRQYVRQSKGRLSLQERIVNGEHFCCLFDPIDCRCTMYENRPKQCRTFPFWEKFTKDIDNIILTCPGVVALASVGKMKNA
ncbi:MAG: YkgJ family cysteine cluster protein [Candidatus Electrothrix sp. EH2]|nr:YkgJ family cysteine cluster protein [Candidatus Electrothrix sp. EH2]